MNGISAVEHLRGLIREVPDFPKAGISFKDFTPLLADPGALALAVELMANPFRGKGIELVIGAESRGFKTTATSALSGSLFCNSVRTSVVLPVPTSPVSCMNPPLSVTP